MNRVEVIVRRIDRFQQRHAVVGLPFAVVQKFGNDQAGGKATIITYYALFALFPLLLLFSTILGFVLDGHPAVEHRLVNSALADFPILGNQLRSSAHPLRGSGWALGVGIVALLYGAQGMGQAAQNAMNTIWNVPFKQWQGFVGRQVRGLAILAVLGLSVLASAALAGFASRFGALTWAWTLGVGTVVDFGAFLAAFTLLTAATVRVRDVLAGAVLASLGWEALQVLGAFYVQRTIAHAGEVYGFFAIVIGLLSWLYLGARLTLLAAEINVVLRCRLWPRSMTQPPLTEQDKATFVRLAKMEERRPEEHIQVSFTAEADRQPLDEAKARTTPPAPAGPERAPDAGAAGGGSATTPDTNAMPTDTASSAAQKAALATRLSDLRHAVVAARQAGLSAEEIAAAGGLDAATIDLWTAPHPGGDRHRPADDNHEH